ncbi:hypothetical protein ACM9HF_02450 [Colwellia sp. RE-S-Sl-9]
MTEVKNTYQPVTGEALDALNAYVSYTKNMFEEQYDFELGYNIESIEVLDNFINTVRDQADDDSKDKLVSLIGTFLGEALISNLGGNWAYYPEGDMGINLKEGVMASPHAKAEKHLYNGDGDSILFFYKFISKKISDEL